MNDIFFINTDELSKKYPYINDGLSNEEIKKMREKYGPNKLKEEKKQSAIFIFLSQFTDFLVIILICAAILSIFTNNAQSAVVIIAVIILNAIIGTVQHIKAEKSLDSLKKLSAPVAKVLRYKNVIQIPSEEIVKGDILLLEAGDIAGADGRILECFSFKVNESILTGESISSEKCADALNETKPSLAEMTNAVFSGTTVTSGRGKVLVTSVGEETQLGKIAELLENTQKKATPLQKSLDDFGKKLSIGIIILCIVIFVINIIRKMAIADSLMFAVALAVAAIPEALSSIVTISLAIGTSKMVKENAIIKNLTAVEGLGCVSVICSDKTGTLTQNSMTVIDTFSFSKTKDELYRSFVLCNDTKKSRSDLIGDPTETALVDFFEKNCGDYTQTVNNFPRIGEIPFDSQRKLMSTAILNNDNITMYTKGATDVLISRITSIYTDGKITDITDEDIKKIKNQNAAFSSEGLRVIAFTKKEVQDKNIKLNDENNYIFLGLAAMIDPLREESKEAVEKCRKAGIKTIMITGDHKITARAIAQQCGIYKTDDIVMTGKEIDESSDSELSDKLSKISVYARVSPQNKIRIVDLWQKKGEVVAMTGDGVNDAPALKKADVGIAMGITGTQVSKDASSMVLTDDNFATIIKSVINGRSIYNNIKNAVGFLISGNTAGIITVLYTSLLSLPLPFGAIQLLFINLITDSLPALAISAEKPSKDLLKKKPRNAQESILTKKTLTNISLQGIIIAIFIIIAYYHGLKINAKAASTMAFFVMCLSRLWHGFNCRSTLFIGKIGLFKNKASWGAFTVGSVLLFMVMLTPTLQKIFNIYPLSLKSFIIAIMCSFIPTVLIQLKRLYS